MVGNLQAELKDNVDYWGYFALCHKTCFDRSADFVGNGWILRFRSLVFQFSTDKGYLQAWKPP